MEVLPILLGGDLNCYGMALAFYEMGVRRSVALGRYRIGVTSHSHFITQICDKRMDHDEGRCDAILEIANKNKDKRIILIGCTDEYASFLIRRKGHFPTEFIIPSPRASALRYADKVAFAEACGVRGIKTPETVCLRGDEAVPPFLPFSYPAVLKPAVSEEYWHHPFEGMRKVWFPRTAREAEGIRRRIRAAGYRGTLLLQECLPVEDSDNYVLTAYSDRFGRVCATAFGRVLLEEHTPRGLGNHAAILTECPPVVCEKVVSFLNEIGYCGFSNFDFLRVKGSDEYYALEMNLRQGRSNHYMTAAGVNPAGLVLSDYATCGGLERVSAASNIFWHSVPAAVIYSHLKDDALCGRLKMLAAAGRSVSPFHTEAEAEGSLLRRLYVLVHEMRTGRRARRLAGGIG